MGPKLIFGLASGAGLFITMPVEAQDVRGAGGKTAAIQLQKTDASQAGTDMLVRFRDRAARILARKPLGPDHSSAQTWADIDRERLKSGFRLSTARRPVADQSPLRSLASSLAVGPGADEQRGVSFGLDQAAFRDTDSNIADPRSARSMPEERDCAGMMPAFNCAARRDAPGPGLRLALAYSF